MPDKLEVLIKKVYNRWKRRSRVNDAHPDEEAMACFFDGCLSYEESERIKAHLAACDDCAHLFALSLNAESSAELKEVPEELLNRVLELLKSNDKPSILDIVLRLKENMLEIINASGDILLGQELIPVPLLRSRKIRDFKEEVTIFKDFKNIRLEVRIENKDGKFFNLMTRAIFKPGALPFKGLRVTLFKDGLELESYLSDSGSVNFEHVALGKYELELSNDSGKFASVVLDIKA
ncbi:MAG: zf-HC2 domain-containing protein [Candidatus Omnitrophica bacterium]|nr:zf-HC2 domain-containing protein [Candidatus Omnitrophota bacterium]